MKNLLLTIFHRRISQINYWFILSVTPYLWPLISRILREISQFSSFTPPDSGHIKNAIVLVSDLDPSRRIQVKGIDLTDAVESWLIQSVRLEKSSIVTSLNGIEISHNNDAVLVVTYDWLSSGNRWRMFFREIFELAAAAKRLNLPVWIMLGDSFDQEYTIPSALLVALAGGSTILQSNTKSEGIDFGLVHPSGPHIWTMPQKNLELFNSPTPWKDRERLALNASSGEPRRKAFSKVIELQLTKQNWKVNNTNHKLSWEDYVELTKNSQVTVTTCWLQQQYLKGSKRTRSKIAKTTVTHRVWEGFAAGCAVVTNSNSTLNSLGFIAGVHFIELWSETDPIDDIKLPNEHELEKIAAAGQILFSKVVRG
jgi:hypothetical protein